MQPHLHALVEAVVGAFAADLSWAKCGAPTVVAATADG
jgi:hypothetical protein